MGLGKTVMMIALIHTNPPDEDQFAHIPNPQFTYTFQNKERKVNQRFAGNLVIMPVSILSQWESELKKHSKEQLNVCVFYKDKTKIDNLDQYDVVITTYNVIQFSYKRFL